MDVSIIIVNFNTINLTLQCIKSIKTITAGINYEIIVVDNHSTDESYKVLSSLDYVKYIYLDNNIGFGGANNIGILNSKGKYILFLNSDTILVNNAITMLKIFLDNSSDEIAGVGTYLLDENQNIIHSYGDFPTLTNQIHFFNKYIINTKPNNTICKQVDYITGADLMIRKNIIDSFGAFDEKFFMYYEETDLQFRISQKGYKFYIIPEAKIIHLEGGSFNNKKQIPIKRLIMQLKSRYLYFMKNTSKIYYLFFRTLYSILNIIPFLLLRCKPKDKIKYLQILLFYNPKI